MDYEIVIREQVLDAPKKGSKKENWITLPLPKIPFYKEQDYDLFSFLAGTEGRIKAYKPKNSWLGVDDGILKAAHFKGFHNHTFYTLKEFKQAEVIYKSYINARLIEISDDPLKKVKLTTLFNSIILRGEFFLTEGYKDYRVLFCFTN